MRVKRTFNKDVNVQTKSDGYVWLKQGEKRIHVRVCVIKFLLDSGEKEVLLTNITDRRLGKNAFKKLYFMRWTIETKYNIVKSMEMGLTTKYEQSNYYLIGTDGARGRHLTIMPIRQLNAGS